jgi:molecular chaperone DnaK
MEQHHIAVGIDFGTSNSAIADVSITGQPQPIQPEGARGKVLPSVVFLGPEGPVVGEAALAEEPDQPARVVRSVKMQLGSDQRYLIDGRPWAPEEIGAEILRALAELVERQRGGASIGLAVLGTPAQPRPGYVGALEEAARLAGIPRVAFLDEPTAAMLGYGLDQWPRQNVLVFDIGAGTCDVSLVYVESGQAYPRYRASNEIAGDRFDQVVAEMLLDEFARQRSKPSSEQQRLLRGDPTRPEGPVKEEELTPESRQLLKRRAEEAKIGMSRAPDVPVPIMIDLLPDRDLMPTRLRREEFERRAAPLVDQTMALIDEALKMAGLREDQVDSVLLVGGSANMPMIRDRLAARFSHRVRPVDEPDTIVARGLALRAGMLDGSVRARVNRSLGILLAEEEADLLVATGATVSGAQPLIAHGHYQLHGPARFGCAHVVEGDGSERRTRAVLDVPIDPSLPPDQVWIRIDLTVRRDGTVTARASELNRETTDEKSFGIGLTPIGLHLEEGIHRGQEANNEGNGATARS